MVTYAVSLRPRSCYDCLNTPVEGEADECMVNDFGKCIVSNVSVFGGGPVQFPAGNTTYCEYLDPQCEYCRSHGLFGGSYDTKTSDERSRFSIGANGCVCTSVCESDTFDDDVGGSLCLGDLIEDNLTENLQSSTDDLRNSTSELQNAGEHKGKGPWMIVSVVLGCAVLLLVNAVVIYRRRFKSSSSANTTSSTTIPASSTPPRPNRSLNLFGWRAKRQHLIDKEQAELGDPDTVAHVASYVQFADVTPSAPDADFAPAAYVASAPDNESTSDTNTDIIKLDTSQ